MKEKGIPIEQANPYPELRKNAETASDWPFRHEAQYLYDRAVLFRERLIDPIARIDRSQMPDPVLSFDNLRNKNTLAAYRLRRNPQGLNYEIILNSQHYEEVEGKMRWKFGEWALNETFAHELVHEWQQTVGEDPVVPGKIYHNNEFVEKCESIGLHPKIGEGYHLKAADGPFAILMNELGIEPPKDVEKLPEDLDIDWFKKFLDELGKGRKGKSSLKKWCCPECGMNVRMGISEDPRLRHHTCETEKGQKIFLIPGDVYTAKK